MTYMFILKCALKLVLKKNPMFFLFVFVNEISCTSTKFAFKITTVAVELKTYSEIKDINCIKSWVYNLWGVGEWGFKVSNWGYSCLAKLDSWFSVLSQLPGSAS